VTNSEYVEWLSPPGSNERIRAESLAVVYSEPFNIADEICAWFVVAVIEWWDIDQKTFRIDLIPNRKLIPSSRARFELAETNRNRCCFGAGFSGFPCGSKLERRRHGRGTCISHDAEVQR
jgi:hypothetical protein